MMRSPAKPTPPPERMASYRRRMREAGFRLIQMWLPDTRSPALAELCRRQALAVAAHDPGGDEIMRWVQEAYQWPDG